MVVFIKVIYLLCVYKKSAYQKYFEPQQFGTVNHSYNYNGIKPSLQVDSLVTLLLVVCCCRSYTSATMAYAVSAATS